MDMAKGEVKNVYRNSVNTKRGPATTFVVMLDDGNKYNCGFKDPKVDSGDSVDIVYEVDAYGNKVKSIEKANGSVATSGRNSVSTVPGLDRNRSIVRQSCLKVASGLIDISTQDTDGKYKLMSVDQIAATTISLAKKFEKYCMMEEDPDPDFGVDVNLFDNERDLDS